MFWRSAMRAGLVFYESNQTIGTVSFAESTWFTGYDRKYYFAKGVYYQAMNPKTFFLWKHYVLFRTRTLRELSNREKKKWIQLGKRGYREMKGYSEYEKEHFQARS